jgi:hypothetical protein
MCAAHEYESRISLRASEIITFAASVHSSLAIPHVQYRFAVFRFKEMRNI